MEWCYELFLYSGMRNIEGYNDLVKCMNDDGDVDVK